MNLVTMRAIFKRDLAGFFGSLTGYLFVLAFVFLCALALIRPGGIDGDFFAANEASLDLLTTPWFPLLVALFVPLMAMGSWAKETDHGTNELLFTLPAHDHELVLAKFGACFGTYSIALAFKAVGLFVMLEWLGDPDLGLLFSTYLGYWLLGAAAIALAMIGSCLTRNVAVAWLLGFFFCVLPATPTFFFDPRGALVELSAIERFASFGTGVIALEDVIYFVGLTAFGLYANTFLLGRRHWTTDRQRMAHEGMRLASIGVAVASLSIWVGHWAARADVTAEQMLSLSEEAEKVLDRLNDSAHPVPPVFVHAWISPEVPEGYLATREGLLRMLREFDAAGGDQVRVAIYETELYSKEAQDAEERFGIKPMPVENQDGGRRRRDEIFLGLAFTCGPRELKIPFFDRGLPIQYELTRAIGAVAQLERSKIGILKSGVDLFGGFDFQSMSRSEDWKVLGDLKKQYDVSKVEGTAAIDTSIDVLVVPMPSSLTQDKLDRVAEYLWSGGRALFFCDPYPEFDRNLAPLRPPGGGQNPFQQQQRQPEGPKGNIEALMAAMGVTWPKDQIVWDDHNPHPEFQIPRELVFVSPAAQDRPSGFNERDPITSGLQEIVTIFGGFLEQGSATDVTFTPLLQSGTHSGRHHWQDMVNETFFGVMPKPDEMRRYTSQGQQQTLAARLEGKLRGTADGVTMRKGALSDKPFQAIVVADMDLVSDVFYALRAQGSAEFNLDNVAFVANCIDALAGDESYIALRKLRPRHRTLTYFEQVEAEQDEQVREETKRAKEKSEEQLAEAQKRLDDAVALIQNRTDLDPRQKRILVEAKRQEENRRFTEAEGRIKDEESAAIRLSETRKRRHIAQVERLVTYSVLGLSPLPAILLGLFVLFRKLSREKAGIDPARRRK